MTGSIPDPRLEAALRAVGAHFQHDPEWYREGVAIALIAADAHDEASGVRRVTAQEWPKHRDGLIRLWDDVASKGIESGVDYPAIVRQLIRWLDQARDGSIPASPLTSPSAADSPVGGVS